MVTKKHIAFFTENLYGGGVERILQTILRYFDYNRFDVTLYSNKCEDVDPLLYPFDVHYHYVFDSIHNTDNPIRVLFKKICNKIKLIIYYNFSARLFYSLFIRKRYEVGIAFIEGYATRILSGAPSSMRKVAWIHIELSTYHWTKVAYRSVAEESDTYSLINKYSNSISYSFFSERHIHHRPRMTKGTLSSWPILKNMPFSKST